MPFDGPIYLYAGQNSSNWPISLFHTQKMLETALSPQSIKQVDPLIDLTQKTRLVVITGNCPFETALYFKETKPKITDYVSKGGRFLGIEAGAVCVTQSILLKPRCSENLDDPAIVALQKVGEIYRQINALNDYPLYPRACVTPYFTSGNDLSTIAVSEDFSAPFKACYSSGPVFLYPLISAKILRRYQSPIHIRRVAFEYSPSFQTCKYQLIGNEISCEHPIAALSYTHKKGKVVLSGIHREIYPDSVNKLHRNAFVHKIFQELNL